MESFAAKVWKDLSSINVNEHTEKKGNLTYLSWTWAWACLMNHYPDSEYSFQEPIVGLDGTVEIQVSVTVKQGDNAMTRVMWLPVMDHRNNAIPNPDMRKISDTRMRCLVKCLAMFGLGHYIYAGEDLPSVEPEQVTVISQDQLAKIKDLIEATETDESVFLAAGKFGVTSLDMIPSPLFDRAISMLEKKQKAILAKVSAE